LLLNIRYLFILYFHPPKKQGLQHYAGNEFYIGEHHMQQSKRDKEKSEACKKEGITLIEVPYTWDSRMESLVEIIRKHLPNFEPIL
jgi:hypothetical protein